MQWSTPINNYNTGAIDPKANDTVMLCSVLLTTVIWGNDEERLRVKKKKNTMKLETLFCVEAFVKWYLSLLPIWRFFLAYDPLVIQCVRYLLTSLFSCQCMCVCESDDVAARRWMLVMSQRFCWYFRVL